MTNEELYNIFIGNLKSNVAAKLTPEFKERFINTLKAKRSKTFLKERELALDIANHCNLCDELSFPLYLQSGVPMLNLSNGLNDFTNKTLEECNRYLENNMITIYKAEAMEKNGIKLHFRMPYVPNLSCCKMMTRYPNARYDWKDAGQYAIYQGWVSFYANNNLTGHLHRDTDMVPATNLCETSYCVKMCLCVLYYIKYVLNQYDYYMNKRAECIVSKKEKPEGKVEGLEELLEQIRNPRMRHLYTFIESERGLDKDEISNYIAKELHMANKIDRPRYERYDMLNLADDLAKNPSGIKYEYTNLARNTLYVLTEVDDFVKSINYNSVMYEKKSGHIVELLSEIRKNRYIVIIGDKKDLRKFLELSPQIDFLFKDNVFNLLNLTPDEMYNKFVEKTSFNVKLQPGFYDEFVEYIALNHPSVPIKNNELVDYLVTYCENHDGLVLPPSKYKKVEIEKMLNDIVGLENIKKKIEDFRAYVLFQQKAKAMGHKIQNMNFHMIFNGNPGTGKTTIARLMTTLLYQLGIIKEDKLIEVERKDLIGQYIGQTAPRTAAAIDKAMGGVLFVDEAYTLASPSKNDFGKEAIATLIKAMEDHSDKFVVIFAGYKREMEDFVDANPGIASRIGYNFDFKDYTTEELTQIFVNGMNKMGFDVPKKLLSEIDKTMTYFAAMDNFGNGRFVKKYAQETLILHSKLNPNNFKNIEKEDLPTIEHISAVVSMKDAEYVREEYSKADLYTFAVHEIGHAFVSYHLTQEFNFEKITISAERAYVNGYVKYKKLMPNVRKRSDYINVIKTALGGMCAEIVFFGEPSDGNSQDLKMASDMAATMMSRIGAFDDMLFVSDSIDTEKERQLNRLLNQYYKETIAIITENKETVEGLAKRLLDVETMTGEDFKKFLKNGGKGFWPF